MGLRNIFGKAARGEPATFLGRLGRDTRGNVLAIMAAALIPLCGLVGGGIDISRMYITKTRLQHACDAGALAGRKQMGAGSWTANSNAANTAALRFFDANYKSGAYDSSALTRSFAENSGKVTGTVSAQLPMTLMRVLGKTSETISVTCDAEMRLPNTDVMFVLDTTGSMNCVAGNASCTNNGNVPATGSKIEGLKAAVKCFYETLAQLDTNQACTGTPSGGTSSAVQLRFGFVPYASNVNVGKLLRSDWFVDSATYQTRQRDGNGTGWGDWHWATQRYYYGCPSSNTSTAQYRNVTTTGVNGNIYTCNFELRNKGPSWNYGPYPVTTSGLKSGNGWTTGASFNLAIADDGGNLSIGWAGCIEERPNWGSTPAVYTGLPTVNDVSQRPTTDVNTRWRPALPTLIFYRNMFDTDSNFNGVSSPSTLATFNRYYSDDSAPANLCPTEARLLQQWPAATAFDTYVDSLAARGNTYHDIGMLWGARLMWPGGMFDGGITGPTGTTYAANLLAANGGQIQRHMIFMTDGDATSNPCDYNSNGVPWFDQRQTTDVGNADTCGATRAALVGQINTRLEALCTIVKNQGIRLWVVSYGGGLNTTTETRLANCASDPDSVTDSYYLQATTTPELQAKFAVIAAAISQLRLTK